MSDKRLTRSVDWMLSGIGELPVADHDDALDLDPEHLPSTPGGGPQDDDAGDLRVLRPFSPHDVEGGR